MLARLLLFVGFFWVVGCDAVVKTDKGSPLIAKVELEQMAMFVGTSLPWYEQTICFTERPVDPLVKSNSQGNNNSLRWRFEPALSGVIRCITADRLWQIAMIEGEAR